MLAACQIDLMVLHEKNALNIFQLEILKSVNRT